MNLVESDEVHPALQSIKKFHDFPGMHRGIIETCKADILERATALMGEVILPEQVNDLRDRHLLFGRHQLATLLWQR